MVVLDGAPADQRGWRAVVHAVRGSVAGAQLDAAPIAEGEQEGFVDLAPMVDVRDAVVPAFQLDGQTDRGAVVQLRLADEMNFTFLNELETLVLIDVPLGA